MKITDKFTFESGSGNKYRDCNFVVRRYSDTDNISLAIVNREEGDIVVCTVNGHRINAPYEIGVKTWSENTGMDDFLVKLGIIHEDCVIQEPSGFVNIKYFRLTKSGRELVDTAEGRSVGKEPLYDDMCDDLRGAVHDAIRKAVNKFNKENGTAARVESYGNYDTDFCIIDGTLDEDEAEPIFIFSNGVGNE